ncbi:hypothetical protein F5Y15DRAFT_145875 [Xylariaceae sp. FL0016]|nr:hypothetical protein F5Y15DRAFT_145875 [Xylariaceae sp. FL0016]
MQRVPVRGAWFGPLTWLNWGSTFFSLCGVFTLRGGEVVDAAAPVTAPSPQHAKVDLRGNELDWLWIRLAVPFPIGAKAPRLPGMVPPALAITPQEA